MAGDWIPMRIDLADDPAVIAIANAIGCDEFSVVGRLHRLWGWANKHLSDGNAPGVTVGWIDRYLSAPGFAAAMTAAGWLVISGQGIEFPKFETWNSQSAKRRALTARRVAAFKARGNAPDVTGALPKEQKKTEETKKTPQGPPREYDPAAEPLPHGAAFRRAWAAWCDYHRQKKTDLSKPTADAQLRDLGRVPEAEAVGTIENSIRNGYKGLIPPKDAAHGTVPPRNPAAPARGSHFRVEGAPGDFDNCPPSIVGDGG